MDRDGAGAAELPASLFPFLGVRQAQAIGDGKDVVLLLDPDASASLPQTIGVIDFDDNGLEHYARPVQGSDLRGTQPCGAYVPHIPHLSYSRDRGNECDGRDRFSQSLFGDALHPVIVQLCGWRDPPLVAPHGGSSRRRGAQIL